ncbi:uncharacterized protein Z518_07126 [Rhinocladiella mackenziei CBS 650.93]|uniref:Uncharacterized protein n=1 Tax=Rhinocladiella mackenziei CBS 650.93 TaxID=1442369 RepID=A0A0D2GZH1_9EURO|nr:uncharacterized protein Z518_07126 [Rhinocladiella mackenziei CBS 650.93]KIX03573.1 hypothetical protein Z518_07126 [Rhinocladiella mackenziei CBS 650.93]
MPLNLRDHIVLNNYVSRQLGIERSPYDRLRSDAYSNKFDLSTRNPEEQGYIQYMSPSGRGEDDNHFFGRAINRDKVHKGLLKSWLTRCDTANYSVRNPSSPKEQSPSVISSFNALLTAKKGAPRPKFLWSTVNLLPVEREQDQVARRIGTHGKAIPPMGGAQSNDHQWPRIGVEPYVRILDLYLPFVNAYQLVHTSQWIFPVDYPTRDIFQNVDFSSLHHKDPSSGASGSDEPDSLETIDTVRVGTYEETRVEIRQ